jgi:hypothetical protein
MCALEDSAARTPPPAIALGRRIDRMPSPDHPEYGKHGLDLTVVQIRRVPEPLLSRAAILRDRLDELGLPAG